jgi:hypothetical protein
MHERHFPDLGDFAACHAAEIWLSKHGFSVGRMQGKHPRGVLFGEYDIQKWRNLRSHERASLHATLLGDMRNGPVTVRLHEDAPLYVLQAFLEGESTP